MKTRKAELFECDACNVHGFTLARMKLHNKTAGHIKLALSGMYVPESQHTHTPTPWHVEVVGPADQINIYPENRNSGWIANTGTKNKDLKGVNEPNAAFIVKAVNAHEELVNALRDVRLHLEHSDQSQEVHRLWKHVDQALAKADFKK